MTLKVKNPNNFRWPVGGFIGLFISVIFIFLVVPLFMKSAYAHVMLQGCFSFLILFTLYTISIERQMLLPGMSLVILTLILDVLSLYYDSLQLMSVAYIVYAIFIAFAIVLMSKRVLTKPIIDTNLIFGAITIYLLAGIFWGKLYFLAEVFSPNSFHGTEILDFRNGVLKDGYKNAFDLLYYSFTTITTLGMGDVAPLHHLVKSLTMLEAVFGQLFVATVIAKMVSVWRHDPEI